MIVIFISARFPEQENIQGIEQEIEEEKQKDADFRQKYTYNIHLYF